MPQRGMQPLAADQKLFRVPDAAESDLVPHGMSRPPEGFAVDEDGSLVLSAGGRHHSIVTHQRHVVSDNIVFNFDTSPAMMIAQALGTATQLKSDLVDLRFKDYHHPGPTQELRHTRDVAQVTTSARLAITRAISSLLAVEYCLCERSEDALDQVRIEREDYEAQLRRSARRRRLND